MKRQRHHSLGLFAVISILAGCAQVSSGDEYVFVATDHYHTCALTEDGRARCWGCEVGSSTSGTDAYETYPGCEGAEGSYDALEQINVYDDCTTGVTISGEVVDWGACPCQPHEWTEDGDQIVKVELARNALTTEGEVLWTCGETRFPGPYSDFSSNYSIACAIGTDAALECWQAGSYEDTEGITDPPDGSFTAVDIHGATACALEESGAVRCWGCQGSDRFDMGQCDDPDGTFTQVDAGVHHACAIDAEGSLHCWGDDEFGQSSPPKGTFVQVAAGEYHTCGVRDDGHVVCWGCGNDRLHHGVNFGQCTPP